MTTIKIIESLVEIQEARRAVGHGFDSEVCDLVIALSEQYIQDQAIIMRSLNWLVKDAKARFEREQEVQPGTGAYSPELQTAIKITGGV